MFKFIHAADIHLDSPLRGLERYAGAPVEKLRQATRRALENMVSLAIREKVNFVIIAGDLFDRDWKDYNTGLYFVQQMSLLKSENIQVFLLKGNHDAESRVSKSLPWPDNVRVFSHKKPETFQVDSCQVSIHGQSFASAAVTEDLSANYPAFEPGRFNIGVLHTCAAGREGHAPYAPCKVEALINKGYDYWALGHIHKREILSKNPLILFPGNIQGRHIRETGSKGCSLVTVDDRNEISESFEELAVMRWEVCQVDASNAKTSNDVLQCVQSSLESIINSANGMPLAVRIEISGRTKADSQIRAQREHFVESVRALAIQIDANLIWIEKVKIHTTTDDESNSKQNFDGPIQELLSYINELSESEAGLESLEQELADLKVKLPSELMELSQLSDKQWYRDSLVDIQQILLDRLLQSGSAK